MSPYKDETPKTVICPNCGREVPVGRRCPHCGQFLPKMKKKWSIPKLTPTEIFLAIIGLIMLGIGLVAV